jgi:hypothetical protein
MKKTLNTETKPESCLASVSGSVICTELRIGNLYEYFILDKLDKRKQWWEITKCDAMDLVYLEKNPNDKDFRYIPITEELLFKIGAIKLDFKDFPSFNLLGTQINFINGIWLDYVTRVEIKGLHHLQNIFYFRNSEELTIPVLTDR